MVQEFRHQLDTILASFDSIDLDDEYKRRFAVKPLYDYFQIILLEVGNQLCGLYRNSLGNCHLEARWTTVKGALEMIEDASRWDRLVITIHNVRMSIEHNDYSIPSKQALLDVRKRAADFANWVLETGQKYHEQSKGFTFVQRYAVISRWYIGQAERFIGELGENPPFCIKEDYELVGEDNSYGKLKTLTETLHSKSLRLHGFDELTKEDLSDLIDIVRVVERVDVNEQAMLARSTCPKCGSKIVVTEDYVGGTEEDGPSAIFHRVGCDKCDYTFDSDTIGI